MNKLTHVSVETELHGEPVEGFGYQTTMPRGGWMLIAIDRHDRHAKSFASGRRPTRGYTKHGAYSTVVTDTVLAVEMSFDATFGLVKFG
jgi:hypothetical protein